MNAGLLMGCDGGLKKRSWACIEKMYNMCNIWAYASGRYGPGCVGVSERSQVVGDVGLVDGISQWKNPLFCTDLYLKPVIVYCSFSNRL